MKDHNKTHTILPEGAQEDDLKRPSSIFLFIVFCAAAASCQNLPPTPTLACNVLNFTVVTPAENTRNFHPAIIPASAAMPLCDKSATLAHSESISIQVNVHLPVPAPA